MKGGVLRTEQKTSNGKAFHSVLFTDHCSLLIGGEAAMPDFIIGIDGGEVMGDRASQ